MPSARSPLHEIMDSNATESPERDATSRRRSGRVVKAPSKFSPEPSAQAVAKRKRDNADDAEDDENDPLEVDEETSDDGDDDSDDDQPRKSRKPSQAKRSSKPTAKKAKINGAASGVTNHTTSIPRRPKKTVRLDTGEKGTGLFGMLLAQSLSVPMACADFLTPKLRFSEREIRQRLSPRSGSSDTDPMLARRLLT
jgi:cohesin complex subunit SA-1/2